MGGGRGWRENEVEFNADRSITGRYVQLPITADMPTKTNDLPQNAEARQHVTEPQRLSADFSGRQTAIIFFLLPVDKQNR